MVQNNVNGRAFEVGGVDPSGLGERFKGKELDD